MKLSIVVPIYNTEKYLEKCINSILRQSYADIEVILVNDNSPGNALEICDKFAQQDSRVVIVNNEKNLGLFGARIAGSSIATGDYIAFVDSDDFVSIDNYRLVLDKMVREDSDICMFKFLKINEYGLITRINNFDFTLNTMTGKEYSKLYCQQNGAYYNFQLVWNKVYSMKLWNSCLEEFKKIREHIIMCEDIIFSTILSTKCIKFTYLENYGIYYLIRKDASTSNIQDLEKTLKYARDVIIVFKYLSIYIRENNENKNLDLSIDGFKEHYFYVWNELLSKYKSNKSKLMQKKLKDVLLGSEVSVSRNCNTMQFFETNETNGYELAKQKIMDPNIKIISFDIFDTLVVRPFMAPSDLFHFLSDYYSTLCDDIQSIDFSWFRINAESIARKKSIKEDITLSDIYDVLNYEYEIPKDVCDKIKDKEKELEFQFCYKRKSIYQLFRLAQYLGKKVVITSDMYLEKVTITEILKKNGYINYEKLYLSSDIGLLKGTSNLFKYMLKEQAVNANEVLHIGDNYKADILASSKVGMNSIYISKPIDLFNKESKENKKSVFYKIVNQSCNIISKSSYLDYLNNRIILAIGLNEIYDNPFYTSKENSDFDSSYKNIGWLVLGPHLLSLSNWIISETKYNDTIHFLSRDGHLLKIAYDILTNDITSKHAKSNYLKCSRKSIVPILFSTNLDAFSISEMIAVESYNPSKIIDMCEYIVKDNFTISSKINVDKTFSNKNEVVAFIKYLRKFAIDENKVNQYIIAAKEYYKQISKNDVTFDLGYSARIQSAINKVLEFPVDTLYVYDNGSYAKNIAKRNNFKIKTFYDFKPVITGAVREYFFSSNEYSCNGFSMKNGRVNIEYVYSSIEPQRFPIENIQVNALNFIRKYKEILGEYNLFEKFGNLNSSLMFEYYLAYSQNIDQQVLYNSYSEDYLHAGTYKSNIAYCWKDMRGEIFKIDEMNNSKEGKSKINKAIYYFKNDKPEFKRRAIIKLNRFPFIYRITRLLYRGYKKIVK